MSHTIIRPLANFPPSFWGDRFSSYTLDVQVLETYNKEIDGMKEKVKGMLLAASPEPTENLKLMDTLERLGVSYLFLDIIEEQIEDIFASFEDKDYDLFTVALYFRMFRQHGYKISCDVFEKFRDQDGQWKKALMRNDAMGMLSLYEATHLKVQGEDMLGDARAFTKAQLELLAPKLSPVLAEQVKHALKQSLHRGIQRVEARWFISIYEKETSMDKTILRLAKLDFNRLQMLHKSELCHITRWWKELDLVSEVCYARDRAVECFLWSTSAYFEPQYSLGRVMLTKTMVMLSVTDDTYDAYGTYDELKRFTQAVQRWDISAVDQLPEYMKALYRALLDVYDDLDKEMKKEGRNYAVNYSKEAFKEIVRSYDVETEWVKAKCVPTFDAYFKNALVTSTGPLHVTSSFIGMGEIANHETFDWIGTKPISVVGSSAIGRLVDDIMSHEEEKKREHVATGLECYMKQHGVTKQEAIDEFYKRIEMAWDDINEEMMKPTPIPMPLLQRILNLSRILDVVYKYDDGYTHPERVEEHVIALFEDPIPM